MTLSPLQLVVNWQVFAICLLSHTSCYISQWPNQWERANFNTSAPKPHFDEIRKVEHLLKTTHHAKFQFDPTTWVVSANTQFATVRFLSLSLPHAVNCVSSVLALSIISIFCHSNISRTAVRICAKFTGKTCLVPCSLEGVWMSRSKVKGQGHLGQNWKNCCIIPTDNALYKACAVCCKSRHPAADRTIPSQPGVTGWRECTLTATCVWCMFGKTSLALVLASF